MNLLAALTLTWFVAAPEPKTDPVEEAKKSLEGEWKVVQMHRDGKQIKDKVGTVTIKGDKMIVRDENPEAESVITLDPKATPATIDIRWKRNGEPNLHKGIYNVEKDKLTLCFGDNGDERPKEFKSTAANAATLLVLERAKK